MNFVTYVQENPPSIFMDEPVIYEEESLERYIIEEIISSGTPILFIGM
jgi:hypothetical protein